MLEHASADFDHICRPLGFIAVHSKLLPPERGLWDSPQIQRRALSCPPHLQSAPLLYCDDGGASVMIHWSLRHRCLVLCSILTIFQSRDEEIKPHSWCERYCENTLVVDASISDKASLPPSVYRFFPSRAHVIRYPTKLVHTPSNFLSEVHLWTSIPPTIRCWRLENQSMNCPSKFSHSFFPLLLSKQSRLCCQEMQSYQYDFNSQNLPEAQVSKSSRLSSIMSSCNVAA